MHPQSPQPSQPADAALARIRACLDNDAFSRLLGLELLEGGLGYAVVRMVPNRQHLNFVHTVHGAVIFFVADAAFGFACNSHGVKAMAIGNYITYNKAGAPDEPLTATAREVNSSGKLATYQVEVRNGAGEVIATMTGTAYRSLKSERPQ